MYRKIIRRGIWWRDGGHGNTKAEMQSIRYMRILGAPPISQGCTVWVPCAFSTLGQLWAPWSILPQPEQLWREEWLEDLHPRGHCQSKQMVVLPFFAMSWASGPWWQKASEPFQSVLLSHLWIRCGWCPRQTKHAECGYLAPLFAFLPLWEWYELVDDCVGLGARKDWATSYL